MWFRAKSTPGSKSHDFIRDVEAPYLFSITGIVRGMNTPAFRAMTVPSLPPTAGFCHNKNDALSLSVDLYEG